MFFSGDLGWHAADVGVLLGWVEIYSDESKAVVRERDFEQALLFNTQVSKYLVKVVPCFVCWGAHLYGWLQAELKEDLFNFRPSFIEISH